MNTNKPADDRLWTPDVRSLIHRSHREFALHSAAQTATPPPAGEHSPRQGPGGGILQFSADGGWSPDEFSEQDGPSAALRTDDDTLTWYRLEPDQLKTIERIEQADREAYRIGQGPRPTMPSSETDALIARLQRPDQQTPPCWRRNVMPVMLALRSLALSEADRLKLFTALADLARAVPPGAFQTQLLDDMAHRIALLRETCRDSGWQTASDNWISLLQTAAGMRPPRIDLLEHLCFSPPFPGDRDLPYLLADYYARVRDTVGAIPDAQVRARCLLHLHSQVRLVMDQLPPLRKPLEPALRQIEGVIADLPPDLVFRVRRDLTESSQHPYVRNCMQHAWRTL